MHGIPKTAVARRLPILGTNFTADQIVATPRCGNFDIILDPFTPYHQFFATGTLHALCDVLYLGDHGHRMLIVARLAI